LTAPNCGFDLNGRFDFHTNQMHTVLDVDPPLSLSIWMMVWNLQFFPA